MGAMMKLITIKSGLLSVTISSKGAEIQSIQDKNGVERMFNGDPAFWPNRAPILFPVEDVKENQATFLLQEKHEGFPFEYDLRAAYTVKDNQLEVKYTVTNRDQWPFCFSIGSHEAYATPTGIEDYEIVFDEEETLAHSPLHGNLNDHETVILGGTHQNPAPEICVFRRGRPGVP